MKNVIALCLLVLCLGCNEQPVQQGPTWTYQEAWVRSVWCNLPECHVVLEGTDGTSVTLDVHGVPPLWAGEKVGVSYVNYGGNRSSWVYDRIGEVKRLQ